MPNVTLDDQLLTIEQAAEVLAVTPAAIRKWLHQRRLTPVKVGRLTRLRSRDIGRIVKDGLPPLAAIVERAL
jgi:excisionase family DNA binding protein